MHAFRQVGRRRWPLYLICGDPAPPSVERRTMDGSIDTVTNPQRPMSVCESTSTGYTVHALDH